MKKFILGLLTLSLMIFSCQQQTSLEEVLEGTKQIEQKKDVLTNNIDIKWRFFTGEACIDKNGNCLPDVEIFRIGDDMDSILDLIKKGNRKDIQTAFSRNRTMLENLILPHAIENMIKGDFTVSSKRNVEESTDFLLFHNKNNDLVLVAPFKISIEK